MGSSWDKTYSLHLLRREPALWQSKENPYKAWWYGRIVPPIRVKI
jgi:hypothetical protein